MAFAYLGAVVSDLVRKWIMMPGQEERRLMVRTDKLIGRTWDGFLRLTPGERRVFLDMLRAWHLQRRIEAVASRGGGPRARLLNLVVAMWRMTNSEGLAFIVMTVALVVAVLLALA